MNYPNAWKLSLQWPFVGPSHCVFTQPCKDYLKINLALQGIETGLPPFTAQTHFSFVPTQWCKCTYCFFPKTWFFFFLKGSSGVKSRERLLYTNSHNVLDNCQAPKLSHRGKGRIHITLMAGKKKTDGLESSLNEIKHFAFSSAFKCIWTLTMNLLFTPFSVPLKGFCYICSINVEKYLLILTEILWAAPLKVLVLSIYIFLRTTRQGHLRVWKRGQFSVVPSFFCCSDTIWRVELAIHGSVFSI